MRIWMDLTDLAAWRGPFTGIQQTVFNLALRYARRTDVDFFARDDVDGQLSPIDFEQVRQRLEAKAGHGRGRIVVAAQRAFDRLPPALRSLAPPLVSRRVRATLERALGLRPPTRPGVPLGPDCVVLVPGVGWHAPALLPELVRRKRTTGCRLAAIVYDLVPVFYPQLYPDDFPARFEAYVRTLASEASALFAISRATRDDVARLCTRSGLAMPDTRVFKLGDSLAAVEPVAPAEAPAPGFILTVGMEGRKNALLLYQMLKLAAEEGIALPQLVIAGRPSWVKGDHELLVRLFARDPQVRERVRMLSGLDDARLLWLYRNCRFTVFPSVCEGWGLPVAESLRQCKLCLSSSASSLPEVGGELAEYASPFDPRAFLELVRRYLDPQRLAEREALIRARYRPHDWDAAFAGFDRELRHSLALAAG